MENKFIVSSSPHVKGKDTTGKIMLDVIIALLPAVVCGTIVFGMRALAMVAVCVISCVVFEYLIRKILKKPTTIGDLSAVVTGILLAMNVPVTLPFWIAIIGCFVAIVITKQLFGGIGKNFANPAIVGRIFMTVSFATPMTNWVIPSLVDGKIDFVSGSTPLVLMSQGKLDELPTVKEMFMGIRGGCIGETAIIALLLGGVYLLCKKVITITIPASYLGTVVVFAFLLGQNPLYHFLAGGVVLGAIFMATDYVTSPTTEKGKLVYGIGCGIITMLIRVFGNYPGGVSFSILLMNILTPHIDRLTRTKALGGIKTK